MKRGVQRYLSRVDREIKTGNGGTTPAAERIVALWVQTCTDAMVEGLKDENVNEIAGLDPIARAALISMRGKERQIATAALMGMMSECMKAPDARWLTSIYTALARAALTQLDQQAIEAEMKQRNEQLPTLQRRKRNTKSTKRLMRLGPSKTRAVARAMLDLDRHRMHNRLRIRIGSYLFSVIQPVCIVEEEVESKRVRAFAFRAYLKPVGSGRRRYYLEVHPRVLNALVDGISRRATLRPDRGPMLVRPFRWSRGDSGGYALMKGTLVTNVHALQKRLMAEHDLTQQYDALAAHDAPALRFNPFIADTVRAFAASHERCPLLPAAEAPEFQGQALTPQFRELMKDREAYRRWKYETPEGKQYRTEFSAHCRLVKNTASNRNFLMYYLREMRELGSRCWWVCNRKEFRGRLVPWSSHVSPHGPDWMSGAIMYDRPKPLTDRGRYWLAVHLANCWGNDDWGKRPLDERAKFVDEFGPMIERVARDPVANREWWDADAQTDGSSGKTCWAFLAACRAWVDPEIGSRLIVKGDATANGLQHFAAMGRDPGLARATNLCDVPERLNPYKLSAGALQQVLQDIADHGLTDRLPADTEAVMKHLTEPRKNAKGETLPPLHGSRDSVVALAKTLLPLCKPALTKQPTMTLSYGATQVGLNEQYFAALKAMGVFNEKTGIGSRWTAASLCALLTPIAMRLVCAPAIACMDHLRSCAKIIANAGRVVWWVAPTGLPVLQPYFTERAQAIKVVGHQLILRQELDELKPHVGKQVNGVVANVVHSYDAAHNDRNAVRCQSEGVEYLSKHDEFGCHAADHDAKRRIVREEFVAVHEKPLLHELTAQWREQHPDLDLPDAPAVGTFDVSEVLRSTYFES